MWRLIYLRTAWEATRTTWILNTGNPAYGGLWAGQGVEWLRLSLGTFLDMGSGFTWGVFIICTWRGLYSFVPSSRVRISCIVCLVTNLDMTQVLSPHIPPHPCTTKVTLTLPLHTRTHNPKNKNPKTQSYLPINSKRKKKKSPWRSGLTRCPSVLSAFVCLLFLAFVFS